MFGADRSGSLSGPGLGILDSKANAINSNTNRNTSPSILIVVTKKQVSSNDIANNVTNSNTGNHNNNGTTNNAGNLLGRPAGRSSWVDNEDC